MAMIDIVGPWNKGYAFDVHTIRSEYKGENTYGHPLFETIRSPMGQFLYELKFKQEFPAIEKIMELLLKEHTFNDFVSMIDIILPVPPSNKYRRLQPVVLIAQEIAKIFKKELRQDILTSSNSEEVKNLDMHEKYAIIQKSLSIEGKIDKSKNILVFDDVFDSGSTLLAMTNALIEREYTNIFVFTLTKTRISN
jgi:predicted amidophosphoribosyltransferase